MWEIVHHLLRSFTREIYRNIEISLVLLFDLFFCVPRTDTNKYYLKYNYRIKYFIKRIIFKNAYYFNDNLKKKTVSICMLFAVI